MRCPLNFRQKFYRLVFLSLLSAVLYFSTNQLSLFKPWIITFSEWEQVVFPWMPGFLWIYLSMYLYIPLAYLTLKEDQKIFPAYCLMQILANLVFFLLPTTLPRELLSVEPALLAQAWEWLWRLDRPVNCFPSLHVANVFLLGLGHKNQKRFWFWIGWAMLIAYSTLVTRQHGLWDVIGGIILAFCFLKLSQQEKLAKRLFPFLQ